MSKFTRTVLVTGGTLNLGYYCALEVAKQHPDFQVIIASRSDKDQAAAKINKTLNQNNVVYLPLDLSSLAKVREFGASWAAANHPPIQALVLNAALQFPGDCEYTVDGVEKTFGITHLGHALLYHLLAPYLAHDARVVVTSSGTHDPAQNSGMPDAEYTSAAEIAFPNEESKKKNNGQQRYATSKLTNVLWTNALARRLEKGRTAVAFDPGLMPGTGLAREYNSFLRFLWLHVLPHMIPFLRLVLFPNIHTAAESGRALASLAIGDNGQGKTGVYYEGTKEIKSSKVSYEESKQEDLWKWTVGYLGIEAP
ncbi:putative short-chain dehydrogenase [Lophiostoma macrostomum CBS 122681]|uniref:Putative short-chain dehydrogenase n=1 Tax=Lophiostoma macrostomum CBS 122681 TaxID=1314788 RepID=A0A6A6TDS1_9PLEO|nr:putative short-chain dehydrogenase [Lophiostoma macrostomum CBS 122681]